VKLSRLFLSGSLAPEPLAIPYPVGCTCPCFLWVACPVTPAPKQCAHRHQNQFLFAWTSRDLPQL